MSYAESTTPPPPTGSDVRGAVRSAMRTWLAVGGVLALITGIVLVIWPGGSAVAVTMILAVYAILLGLVYVWVAFAEKTLSTGARIGHGLAGVIFIVAGIVALMNPATTATALAIIVVTFIAIAWIFEGVASLTTLSMSRSKGWTVFFAIVSILAGIALLFAPLIGALTIALWIGFSLIAIGVFGIVRAITFNKA